ncbi:MAG TPA: class I SAM-dependent methyltransferase [Opitutaceae bacterium]
MAQSLTARWGRPPRPATIIAEATCRICGSTGEHESFTGREMMFGTRESFAYFKCASCGCLQISEIPGDLARHYPGGYYSFRVALPQTPPISATKRTLKAWRLDAALGRGNIAGRLMIALTGRPEIPKDIEDLGLHSADRILDVGCGNGRFLALLRHAGFQNLTGIDPFMPEDLASLDGIALHRSDVADFEGEFDAIFIQHTLEHMPDQLGTMRHLRRLEAPTGKVIVRIPVTGSAAEKRYGTDWVQWDAPRHLFIHSKRSMQRLCADAGLRIAQVIHDSSEFCLLGSEQYRRGVPLEAEGSWVLNREANIFGREEIALCSRIAARMNRLGRGDQATFILERV